MNTFILLSLSGLLAGFINGFFGTGGGLVIFYTLSYIGSDTRSSFAGANAVMLVLSLISFVFYYQGGVVTRESFEFFTPTDIVLALLGGALGALLSSRLSPKFLKSLFSLLIIFCGGRLLFS